MAVLHGHFDHAAGMIVANKTKINGRIVALPSFIHEVLLQLPKGKDEDPLFGYASRYSVTRILKRACNTSGQNF